MPSRHLPTPLTPKKARKFLPVTPRKRKTPGHSNLQSLHGIRNIYETVNETKGRMKKLLRLEFEVDDWQAQMVNRIRRGYDSILIAGTGYGKSLIFQGLAALAPEKTVIVISPLKALERDQVAEAAEKHLSAAMINQNTASPEMWQRLRKAKDQLYYVSPEMALGDAFTRLWQDRTFRSRVQAVIVDEAHCIAEWGDEFRKEYSGLSRLRNYIGQDVPIMACTATCTTESFNTIWSSLAFGNRPFWGLDAGCDRKNLTFIVRTLENKDNAVLDVLNIFPEMINADTLPTDIPKCLFYFETLAECSKAMETIRKILPPHLRHIVQTFVGLTSEAGKALTWDRFRVGEYRILCATDAAGMGCNVSDVRFVSLFCVPRSLSVLVQRWGRAGRRRNIHATCFLFVQKWAFRPRGPALKTKTGKDKPLEPRSHTLQREKIDKPLENLINLGFDESKPGCVHQLLRSQLRPDTGLNVYHEFTQPFEQPSAIGNRSQKSQFQLSWTILQTRDRRASSQTCCEFCIPQLKQRYQSPSGNDPRLVAYASDFIFPLQITATATAEVSSSTLSNIPTRPHSSSITSTTSTSSTMSSDGRDHVPSAIAIPMSQSHFVPLCGKFTIPESQRQRLEDLLKEWRESKAKKRSRRMIISSELELPGDQLRKLTEHGGDFLRSETITPKLIKEVIRWDLASAEDLQDVVGIISNWRNEAKEQAQPTNPTVKRKKLAKLLPEISENDLTPSASPIQRSAQLPLPGVVPTTIPTAPLPAKNDSPTTPVARTALSESNPFLSSFGGSNIPNPIPNPVNLPLSTSSRAVSSQVPVMPHYNQPPTTVSSLNQPPQLSAYYRNASYPQQSGDDSTGNPSTSNPAAQPRSYYRAQTAYYRTR